MVYVYVCFFFASIHVLVRACMEGNLICHPENLPDRNLKLIFMFHLFCDIPKGSL